MGCRGFTHTIQITNVYTFFPLRTLLILNYAITKKNSQLIYIEACESGSMFEGLLPNNYNIYATTASNAEESSYATYCPGDDSAGFDTCLGDLYSISWLEDWYAIH